MKKIKKLEKVLLTILLTVICPMLVLVIWHINKKETSPSEPITEKLAVKLSDLIPDPKTSFPDRDFEIVTLDDSYTVYLDYVSEEEWNDYISKCEENSFWTKETYRSNYSWYVYSEDKGYQLMLDRYGDQNEYMTILVKHVVDDISE